MRGKLTGQYNVRSLVPLASFIIRACVQIPECSLHDAGPEVEGSMRVMTGGLETARREGVRTQVT